MSWRRWFETKCFWFVRFCQDEYTSWRGWFESKCLCFIRFSQDGYILWRRWDRWSAPSTRRQTPWWCTRHWRSPVCRPPYSGLQRSPPQFLLSFSFSCLASRSVVKAPWRCRRDCRRFSNSLRLPSVLEWVCYPLWFFQAKQTEYVTAAQVNILFYELMPGLMAMWKILHYGGSSSEKI